jgi:hypothetical protein
LASKKVQLLAAQHLLIVWKISPHSADLLGEGVGEEGELYEKFKPIEKLHMQYENPGTSTVGKARQKSLNVILHLTIA